jgi:hypothetical protein
MYIQVMNIKLIFETQNGPEPTAAEVEYKVVLNNTQTVNKLNFIKDGEIQSMDLPEDKLTGKMIIVNASSKRIECCSMVDFQMHIHDTIMNGIK